MIYNNISMVHTFDNVENLHTLIFEGEDINVSAIVSKEAMEDIETIWGINLVKYFKMCVTLVYRDGIRGQLELTIDIDSPGVIKPIFSEIHNEQN